MRQIAWIHYDIFDRVHEFRHNIYPRSHLWGFPMGRENNIHFLNPLIKNRFVCRLLNFFSIITKHRLGDFYLELSIYLIRNKFDLIYFVSGNIVIIPLLKRLGLINVKLSVLLYKLPENSLWWKFHNLNHSLPLLNSFDGINCLTKNLKNELNSKLTNKKIAINCIPWATDGLIFYKANIVSKGKYFFCGGKTNRDHISLLKSAAQLPSFRFIIIKHWEGDLAVPSNVKIIESNTLITDKAISYDKLRLLYAECIAVCIPLNYDPKDTCGYTEMLEAITMQKPIIMTKSGCLDIELEENNLGYYVKPNDSFDWVKKLKIVYQESHTDKNYNYDFKTNTINNLERQTTDFLLNI